MEIELPLILFFYLVNLSDIAAGFGILSSGVIAIAVVTGTIWFIVKGRTIEEYKSDLSRAEKDRDEYRKKLTEAEADCAKAEKLNATLELEVQAEQRKARRAEGALIEAEKEILRLQAELKLALAIPRPKE